MYVDLTNTKPLDIKHLEDEVNKAIELTKFNVSPIYLSFHLTIENQRQKRFRY